MLAGLMLRRRWRLARTLFGVLLAEVLEYRAEILIWMAAATLPLIMMLIWMGLAEDGPMGGYSVEDFAAYFLLVFLVRQASMAWVVEPLSRDIRLGELSPHLLRPLDPYWMWACYGATSVTIRLPVAAAVTLAGLALTGALDRPSLSALPFFVAAAAGAWLIRFNMLYGFGLLAFWTEQATAVESLFFTFYMIFGGGLIPLDLFPEAIRRVLVVTPFPYMIDFPVKVLLGRLSAPAMLQGFAIQVLWIVLFVGLHRLLWRRGLKRYSAVGA